jgi:hypothetical protein
MRVESGYEVDGDLVLLIAKVGVPGHAEVTVTAEEITCSCMGSEQLSPCDHVRYVLIMDRLGGWMGES